MALRDGHWGVLMGPSEETARELPQTQHCPERSVQLRAVIWFTELLRSPPASLWGRG